MKLSQKNKIVILVVAVLAVIALSAIVFIRNHNTIDLSDYITVNYYGANGYASAECVVDTDKLYQNLAGKERDMEKLTNYRKIADSLEAAVEKNNISNGTVIQVITAYDEQTVKDSGYKIRNASYHVRANGISEGTKIDLYDRIAVTFAGVSPEAYVVIDNQWDDEYLKSLTFTADKYSMIARDDTITLSCTATREEIAAHGYIVSKTQAEYRADQLSTYVDSAEEINQDILKKINETVIQTITTQTEDMSFRMLYKATKDNSYLYQENDEKAENIESSGNYFLTKKSEDQAGIDNYLYTFYKADIVNSSTQMTVYFAFEFSQGYVEKDGSFDISYDKPEDKYTCFTSYDEMYQSLIEQKSANYEIHQL